MRTARTSLAEAQACAGNDKHRHEAVQSSGADKATGQELSVAVDARSYRDAEAQAFEMGLLVAEVTEEAVADPPCQPCAAAWSTPGHCGHRTVVSSLRQQVHEPLFPIPLRTHGRVARHRVDGYRDAGRDARDPGSRVGRSRRDARQLEGRVRRRPHRRVRGFSARSPDDGHFTVLRAGLRIDWRRAARPGVGPAVRPVRSGAAEVAEAAVGRHGTRGSHSLHSVHRFRATERRPRHSAT